MDRRAVQLCNIGGNEFAVQVHGKGTPLVWGHCLLGSMDADDSSEILDFDRLSAQTQLIRYDARGHGDSAGSTNAHDYAWKEQARDMWAIADHYAAGKKTILGGASMGSATALHAAVAQPERVAGLVLVLPPTAWRTRAKQANMYRKMSRIIGWVSGASRMLLRLMRLDPRGKPVKRALAIAVSEHIGQAHPPYLRGALLGAAESDLPDLSKLRNLHIPTTILTWTDDDSHPVSTAEILHNVMPDVRVYRVSGADDTQRWTAYIEEMLKSL